MNTKVWYLPYLYSNDWNILECGCTYGTYGSYYDINHREDIVMFCLGIGNFRFWVTFNLDDCLRDNEQRVGIPCYNPTGDGSNPNSDWGIIPMSDRYPMNLGAP